MKEAQPMVYMTTDISPKGMMKVYEAMARELSGNVSVKLSTGAAGNTHYLNPTLIKDLVKLVDGTIVECNTAYGGSRASLEHAEAIGLGSRVYELVNLDS